MAEGLWTNAVYPKVEEAKIDAKLEALAKDRIILDDLDAEIASYATAPDPEIVKNWARTASGIGNKFRKLHLQLEALVKNVEANRFMTILMECEERGIKFTAVSASQDAANYVAEIRRARNVAQGYVEAADNVISICRLHLGSYIASVSADFSS